MSPQWFGKKRNATLLASSGNVVEGAGPASPDAIIRRAERWQSRVLALATGIPESSGAIALIEDTMGMVDLKTTGLREKDVELIEGYLSRFDLGRAGMLEWLVGEYYSSWTIDLETNEIEWEVYSPIELKVKDRTSVQILGPDNKYYPPKSGVKWYRTWKPDPGKRFMAWSPHKGLVDLMDSMYVHQLADTAVATSRLAGAGILYWPTNLQSMPRKNGIAEPGSQEELQDMLTKAMMDTISDRNSADATVPVIAFGDIDQAGMEPKHILLERPDNAVAFAARMDSYATRYARGVELPIESVEGIGQANHWTAWVIKEDKWKFYISPIANNAAQGLQKNFVRPLVKALGYTPEEIKKVTVYADGARLVDKPDKSDAALRLAQLGGIISDRAVLEETGFDPDTQAASPEEKAAAEAKNATRIKELPAQYNEQSNMGNA